MTLSKRHRDTDAKSLLPPGHLHRERGAAREGSVSVCRICYPPPARAGRLLKCVVKRIHEVQSACHVQAQIDAGQCRVFSPDTILIASRIAVSRHLSPASTRKSCSFCSSAASVRVAFSPSSSRTASPSTISHWFSLSFLFMLIPVCCEHLLLRQSKTRILSQNSTSSLAGTLKFTKSLIYKEMFRFNESPHPVAFFFA